MIWTQFYRFASKVLRVRASDEGAAQAVERFMGDYHLSPVDEAADGAVCTIEINCGGAVPPVPNDSPAAEIFRGYCRANAETLYLAIDDSLIVVGPPAARVVKVWLGAQTQEPFSVATVLSYTMHAALRRCGFYELHAAGVTTPAGAGALLIGAAGSGKSTLTLQLAAKGWRYLSDDRLVLAEDAGVIAAWGLRRVFSVTEQTLAACASAVAGATGQASYDLNKRRLEPRAAFPAGFAESCVPRALFFTGLAEQQESRVIAVAPAEAMLRLVEHCPWTCYDPLAAREHLRVLERLVKQSRAYRLLAGRELLDQPERAARLLAAYV